MCSVNSFKVKSLAIAWDLYHENTTKVVRESRGDGHRQQDLPRKGIENPLQ